MLESTTFEYDGKSSSDFGVKMVYVSGGQFQEQLMGRREVKTERIRGKDKSILKSVVTQPLSFNLPIYLEGWKDRNNLREFCRWFFQEDFKPLRLESNMDIIYYCMPNGDISLVHNGIQEGYVTIPMICNSNYAYSDLHMDSFTVNGTVTRSYFNTGDGTIRPQLKLKKIGNGDISIKNEKNGQEMKLTNIYNNEILWIVGETEEIVSSLESSNRYILEEHNDVWLDFETNYFDETIFTFTGNFECEFYYEYKYLTQDRPVYFE